MGHSYSYVTEYDGRIWLSNKPLEPFSEPLVNEYMRGEAPEDVKREYDAHKEAHEQLWSSWREMKKLEQKEKTMTGQLFWVCILRNPTKKEKDDGRLSVVEDGPKLVVARSEKDAVARASNDWPVEDNTEVVVVPFGG